MKRSRRTRPISTPNRDVYDDASDQVLRSPDYSLGMSEEGPRGVGYLRAAVFENGRWASLLG